jgi:hypothetical protein
VDEPVVDEDDINILIKIKEIFFALKEDKVDWADLISDKEKRMTELGIKQADDGQLISHKDMRNNINQWLNEKRK